MDKLSVSKYYWNLISCLALSKDILSNADHLKDFLRVLNPLQEDSGSSSGVLTEMLTSLKVVPRLAVESGSPLRQLDIEIQVDAVGDLAEELYLFGTVLNRLFKHTSHINTRIAMTLLNIRSRKPALNWSRW
jgi:type VI protein secretion system component VasA